MSSVTAPTLSARFAVFIKVLADALGYRCNPLTCGLSREELARVIPILSLFYQRALRYARRFQRFAEAEDPASLNPKPRRRKDPDPNQPQRPQPAKPRLMLPRQFGWLRKLVPDPHAFPGASQIAGYLMMLLRDPELATLIETCPTLARSLRPLCHALGIRQLGPGVPLPFPTRAPRKPRASRICAASQGTTARRSAAQPPKAPKPKPPRPVMPPPIPQPPAPRRAPNIFLSFPRKITA